MVRVIPLEGVGTANRDRSFALFAIAAELRAGDTVGLGLGAAGGEVDGNRLSLRWVRHLMPPGRPQDTPAPMSHMSQMDYVIFLFPSRRDP